MKTKRDMIIAISNKTGLSMKDVEQVINALVDYMKNELLTTGRVALTHFGRFEVIKRKDRLGVNPNTKERIKIKEHKGLRFNITRSFKEKLNEDE